MKECPFPSDTLALGVEGVLQEIKKAVKKTVCIKKARELVMLASRSIGLESGLASAKLKLRGLLGEYEMYEKQLREIEAAMDLEKTGLKDWLLSIPGIGVINLASFLGKTGDLSRFTNGQQIVRLAGYNLTENSSGKKKPKSSISKRGGKNLRNVLYQKAMVMVSRNAEMKKIYEHLKSRRENPLKKKQGLAAIACRIARMLFSIAKYGESYDPSRVAPNLKAA